MYKKEEGIFDHPPLANEVTPDTSIDNPGDGKKIPIWVKVLGLVIVSSAVGYYIYKMISQKEKKKNSQVMGKRNDYF